MLKLALVVPFFVHSAVAICGGFDFGIGSIQNAGDGFNRWVVYDNSCNTVDSLVTNGNACFQGIFGCSPAPVLFDSYKNKAGQIYNCRTDPSSGTCGSDVVSVCCRDDWH